MRERRWHRSRASEIRGAPTPQAGTSDAGRSVRILFLTHRLPYAPNRGDRIRAFHLLRILSARFDVDLISLVHDEDERHRVDALRSMTASVSVAPVRRGRLAAAALALPTSRPLTHVLLHSPQMPEVIREVINRRTPDVVLAYCTGMARYALEPPLASIPCLLDMVDVDSAKWEALSSNGSWPLRAIYRREARLLRRFERQAIEHAAATTVVNEREHQLLADIGSASRVVVVPNGVDLDAFTPTGPPATEPRVVFCGVFNYGPNEAGALWLASRVWPLVRNREPRAQLSLVGMNPSRAVAALSHDPTIHVTGAVPDVRPYLWDAAVSVAPLHVARGVQNKVLEAIASGLPCVVTPAVLEGLPAAARAACRSASEPQAFADSILCLLRETPEARRGLSRRARIEDLVWESQLHPMIDLVASIAQPQPITERARPGHH
jgi:sugar transferase (PEP-CTERM/EpsH1 system associated)